jgi:uncharacterized membrane protein (UPF0127 family)
LKGQQKSGMKLTGWKINSNEMLKNKFPVKNILAVISITITFFVNFGCQKNVDNTKIETTTEAEKLKFVKQGEVYFQDKNKTLIKQVDVEIADNDERRHLGLMFRERMDENQGMLFIFDNEEPEGFYMKNTIIPLDIIFINSKKEIVKAYKNTTPFSEKDLESVKPAIYVVEVNAGFMDKYNIKEGDFIDWRRN